MTDHLKPISEDWDSALAIVAHPDDLEYGTAAAVARWTGQGKKVSYLLVTRGEAGIDSVPPVEAGPLRVQEQIDGAKLVGVDEVEFLDYPDGMVTYSLELRRDIARAVRRHRPEVVITGNHHSMWGPGMPNQADHIAVGRAVLDGVRDAANRWVFTELLDEGLQPWSADWFFSASSPQSDHFVEVTDSFAAGVASLEAHKAYLEGLGEHPMSDPERFLAGMAEQVGVRAGVARAVAFEVYGL